jgi:CHAD domain-containing protein
MQADMADASSSSRMSAVLERCLRRAQRKKTLARRGLEPGTIHDVRVALRRCRSLAEGFANLDPHPVWRKLLKACKKQQNGLADFRDLQVMREWLRRLPLSSGPVGRTLSAALTEEGVAAQKKAETSLDSFPQKRWKRWQIRLPARAQIIPANQPRLAMIALERLARVRRLDRHWHRQHTMSAWHRLRVAVKRFRYIVESFLPEQHAAWKSDLKMLQDLLGEGHDLDVLRAKILDVASKKHMPKRDVQGALRQVDGAIAKRVMEFEKLVYQEPPVGRPGERKLKAAGSRVQTPWDRWRLELRKVAGVTARSAEGRAPSSASRVRPAAARIRRSRGALRRISSAP